MKGTPAAPVTPNNWSRRAMPHLVSRRSVPLLCLPLLLAALAPLAACGGNKSSGTQAQPRRTTNINLLTREEMQGGHWANAYDLVESLRPRWLSSRGAELADGSAVEVQVYLDNQRLGGPNSLRQVPVDDVETMQFIDPVSAAARWGAEHRNGAILMSTRHR